MKILILAFSNTRSLKFLLFTWIKNGIVIKIKKLSENFIMNSFYNEFLFNNIILYVTKKLLSQTFLKQI